LPISVGILIFDNVEVLDFAGPYEVFTTATRVHGKMAPGAPAAFDVVTVARSSAPRETTPPPSHGSPGPPRKPA
jgi:putative intracellular protease/amidase